MTSPATARPDRGVDTARQAGTGLRTGLEPLARFDGRSRGATSLTRRYEIAALRSDLTVQRASLTAPALPLFEDAAAAFARGTLIPTVTGPVAVEDIVPGDVLETEGAPEQVVWVGSTSYVPGVAIANSALTSLTRVVADAMAPGRPASDLVFGPGARMVIERPRLKTLIGQPRVLVPVRDYEDGERFVSIAPGGSVQLFHLATRHHAVIRAGGMLTETYHPGTGIRRQLGDLHADSFLALFPHVSGIDGFGQLCLPRTSRNALDSLGSG